VLDAFVDGLEQARANGHDLAGIASVASFFVSRVDAAIDPRLDEIGTPEAAALRGKAAIANARLAYGVYEEVVAGDRWQALAAAGAHPQRPLWASTGVKDKAYPDTRYVDELVVAGVVNTMPEATLQAVADHGDFRGDTVTGTQAEAQAVVDGLAALGIHIDEVTDQLETEGVDKFEKSWAELLDTVRDGLAQVTA
jgi:transaldolase